MAAHALFMVSQEERITLVVVKYLLSRKSPEKRSALGALMVAMTTGHSDVAAFLQSIVDLTSFIKAINLLHCMCI